MFSSIVHAQINFTDTSSLVAINISKAHCIEKNDIRFPAHHAVAIHELTFRDCCADSKNYFTIHDSLQAKKRYPLWAPCLSVIESTAVLWTFDRYILNETTSKIGINSWKYNLKYGWEWGKEKFGQSFFFNIISGASYFNSARPLGYSFYESIPFAIGGSVLLEFFGHTMRPTYNDIIYTPVNGVFFGEILYRLSSDVLDERTTGFERVMREIGGGMLDPGRAVSRLFQGRIFKVAKVDSYEKEPLDFAVKAGFGRINNGTRIGTGSIKELLNLSFNYGNPFEIKDREIMDYFTLHFDFINKSRSKWLENVSEYGLLCGKNKQFGKKEILLGLFQYYDFIDNTIYDISAMAFGGGFISRSPIRKNTNLLMNFHLGIVPFGGNSRQFGIDTSQFRKYNFGGGLESKLECTLDICNSVVAEVKSNYYWLHSYNGLEGNFITGIIRPRIVFRFLKHTEIGIEYLMYYNSKYAYNVPAIHYRNYEEKIFLAYHLNCCEKK